MFGKVSLGNNLMEKSSFKITVILISCFLMANSEDIYESINQYNNLIEKYPDKKKLNYNLGNLYYSLEDYENAAIEYNKALSGSVLDTLSANALYNLGNINFINKEYNVSKNYFKESLKLNPNDYDAKYNYELSNRLLEQQESESNSEDSSDNEESSDSENSQDKSNSEDSSDNETSDKKTNKINDKKLDIKEAKAILDALKSNELNIKNNRYGKANRKGHDKDW